MNMEPMAADMEPMAADMCLPPEPLPAEFGAPMDDSSFQPNIPENNLDWKAWHQSPDARDLNLPGFEPSEHSWILVPGYTGQHTPDARSVDLRNFQAACSGGIITSASFSRDAPAGGMPSSSHSWTPSMNPASSFGQRFDITHSIDPTAAPSDDNPAAAAGPEDPSALHTMHSDMQNLPQVESIYYDLRPASPGNGNAPVEMQSLAQVESLYYDLRPASPGNAKAPAELQSLPQVESLYYDLRPAECEMRAPLPDSYLPDEALDGSVAPVPETKQQDSMEGALRLPISLVLPIMSHVLTLVLGIYIGRNYIGRNMDVRALCKRISCHV